MVKSFENTSKEAFPRYFCGISFNTNNQLALTCSNLTTRNWDGVIAVFNDAKFAPHTPHVDYRATTQAGCTDIAWIDDTKLVVSSDSGGLEIWDLKDDSPTMENSLVLSEHGNVCSSVSVSSFTQQLVSGSWDNYIKLWDLEADFSIHTILIHADKVLDVKWNSFSSNIFASASEDGTVNIYDNRGKEKPAFTLCQEKTYHPTAIGWFDQNELVVGNSNGDLFTCDLANPNQIMKSTQAHTKTINNILITNKSISTASEDMSVKVFDGSLKETYHDTRHTDYVTGLGFDPKNNLSLWSCGWDGQVLSHSLNDSMET